VGRFTGSVFVGRSIELAAMRNSWTSAVGGQPGWVLVGGEAGIGKTRLVAEFAREASAQGARVAIGNCPPVAPGLVPFAPVAEMLRALGPSIADGLPPGQAEALERLVELEMPAGHARIPGESDQARLLAAVRAVLECESAKAPLLLVFEDLHWADASTHEVLAFLASQPPRGPVMFVGTYRDEERAAGLRMWRLIDHLYRPGTTRLDLPRLGTEELAGLLNGLLGHRPEGATVDAVLSRSGGNPFLAEELVAADALSGVLPEGLRNLLLARVIDLPEAARQVVGLAAAAGFSVDDELLEQAWLAAHGETTRLVEALRAAVATGVLIGVPGRRSYAFRHALVREAVYDDLLPGDRSRWHRELAGCLAQAASGQGAGHAGRAARIAHHWLAAGDRARALDASIAAAEAAEQAAAFGEASRQYRTAADLWDELQVRPAESSPWTLARLLERAALTSYFSGDPERAILEVTRAIELTDAASEPARVGLMYDRRSRYRWSAGHPHDDTLRDARTAVELVPDRATSARAKVLAALGAELMLGHRFSEAITFADRALMLARAVGSSSEIVAHALSTLGISRAYSGEVTEGVKLAEESVQVAAQAGDTENLYRSYGNLAAVLMLHDMRRSADVALEGAKGADRDGFATTYGRFLIGNAVASLLAVGDWARAESLLADAMNGPSTEPISAANLLVSSVVLAAWRDDASAVDRDLAQIDVALAHGGDPDMRSRLAVAAAEATTWRRAYGAAMGYLVVAAAAETGTDDIDMGPQVAATGLRLLADWRAPSSDVDRQRAAITAQLLAIVAAAQNRNAPGDQTQAYLLTAQAEASRLAGASDADLWRAAAQAWERVPTPHRAGYARFRLAEALLARKGERRHAQAELAAVFRVARHLGAAALAEEAQDLATRSRLTLAVADSPGPFDAFGLTRRERDVLLLVSAGYTNRQIAARLFISPKTVELHVSHILNKLSVANRGEAAAMARRAGLDRGSD
jgi:DNA-binding CsgD family transcriptional regulator